MSSPPPNSQSAAADRIVRRLEEFRGLRARGALSTEVTGPLAQEAASAFLSHYQERGEYLRDAITLLAEIATLEESCLAESGHRATFPLLVETLSDSFDPRHCALYDRAFAQMISYCRQLPSTKDLDDALRRFGLYNEGSLLERKARLRARPPFRDPAEQGKVQKVLILSRVTLGADVAITSVALEKARRIFPQAERVLFGSAKLQELFGGDGSLQVRGVRYETGGGLLDRLRNWLPLLEAVKQEVENLRPEEYLMVDPDSRLLQLGLLPALEDESRYYFFESRPYGELGQGSLSRITLRWLNRLFGREEEIFPALWLREQDLDVGREVSSRLRGDDARYLVAVSFGVGGNPRKRLPDPFEELLLEALLEEGSTVLLDKGFGQEEAERAQAQVDRIEAKGWPVANLDPFRLPNEMAPLSRRGSVFTWQGGIGTLGALIAESDEYMGYDSAGQHIAAALGVPAVDIFSQIAPPVFRERWQPTGPGIVKVAVESDSDGIPKDLHAFLREVMALHQEVRTRART